MFHFRFLKTILGECQRIVLTKLNIANHSKQENRTRLDQLTRDANNLERIREEVKTEYRRLKLQFVIVV